MSDQTVTGTDAFVTPHSFFPFPEIRPTQQRAMDAWNNAMAADKRFVVMELPTGTGKSPLAFAVGSWGGAKEFAQKDGEAYQKGAYILTTQKSLQAQYLRDFETKGMVELRGAVNYRCATHNTDCRAGGLLNRANKALIAAKEGEEDVTFSELQAYKDQHPTKCSPCSYNVAKGIFAGAPLGVTNFSYLLSEARHVGHLKPRSLLIIDEAHNTEGQLLGFVEIEITAKRCEEVGAERPVQIQPGETARAREWILKEFLPHLKVKIESTRGEMLEAEGKDRERTAFKLSGMEQFQSRIDVIVDDECTDWFSYSDPKTGALKLRPLTARSIAEDYLFRMGHKLLFLSATILDGKAFIRGLGLDGPTGGFLRVDSDFPVENRPIIVKPVGSMSFKNIDTTTPKMVRMIEKALDKHPDEKGLIHTHSYKLTQAVVDHLLGTKHRERIIYHDTAVGAREQAVVRHVNSLLPSVLISPSMTEGLDLAEDLSRFQVITKVPYPYLGDPFVKARMAHDEGWYQWQTALTIVQATGRSIRSRTDHATTYLLDADFEGFLSRADAILPGWWKKSLIFK